MKHKKLIITLASVGGALIILASILLGFYCPRKLGFYFNVKADKIDSVYVVSHELETDSETTVYLDKDKTKEFIKALKKVKVKPVYGGVLKVKATQHYFITCGDTEYKIDAYWFKKYENDKEIKSRHYNGDHEAMKKLLKYFDM